MTLEQIRAGQVFLVDKPLEWTSFDVVNKIRYTLKKTFGVKNIKVGHAGTLDPLASGLLVVCAGAETKNADQYQGREKEYTGSFMLGACTPSYDRETEVTDGFPTGHITPELLADTVRTFTGDILQRPPLYSAINVEGKRAYLHARKGAQVEIEARPVTIRAFEITAVEMPRVDFRVVCSKGLHPFAGQRLRHRPRLAGLPVRPAPHPHRGFFRARRRTRRTDRPADRILETDAKR